MISVNAVKQSKLKTVAVVTIVFCSINKINTNSERPHLD